MADNRKMSDTMEINSILAEAHALSKTPDKEPDTGFDARRFDGSEEIYDVTPVSVDDAEEEDDGFVIAAAPRPRRTRPEPKRRDRSNRKPAIICLAIVGAILIAVVAGFLIWKNVVDNPNVADNVIVSGVSVGGMRLSDAMAALAPEEQKLADEISVEVLCGDRRITLTKEDFVYSFDTEQVLRKAQQGTDGRSSGYRISLVIDDEGFSPAVEKISAAVSSKPEDAKVTAFQPQKSEMFTIKEGVSGLQLKNDDFIAQIKKLLDSGRLYGTVSARCEEAKPEITAEYLRENLRMLSSFTTVSTNTWNGTENMRVSLAACSGSVIEPGKTWSFNQCTGDSNLESNGYKPAGVIIMGKHEIGIGGGICQSATTIYNAGLLCGMEIVERYCHYYPSSYVAYGRDATIDYGNLDLKLRNPFEHQLFLKCYLDGSVLHAEIYGLPEKDFDEIRISTTDPSYFSTGYTVKATRTFCLNGKTVRTEELPSSTYYYAAPDDGSSSSATTPAEPTEPGGNPTETPSAPDEPTAPGGDPIGEPSTSGEPGGDTPATDAPGQDPPQSEGQPGGEPAGGPGQE